MTISIGKINYYLPKIMQSITIILLLGIAFYITPFILFGRNESYVYETINIYISKYTKIGETLNPSLLPRTIQTKQQTKHHESFGTKPPIMVRHIKHTEFHRPKFMKDCENE